MSSHTFPEKVQLFDQIDALDEPDTSSDDDGTNEVEEQHRRKCRAFFESRKKPRLVPRLGMILGKEHVPPNQASQTRLAPTLGATTPHAKVIEGTPIPGKDKSFKEGNSGASFIEDTPVPDSARAAFPALQRRSTHPLLATSTPTESSPSASTSTMRKRKRNSLPLTKSIPESDQIFRNLAFYYIPNNDVAPARKIRIGKAQEYGAKWVRTLDSATHVIVDKNLTYKDIEKILQLAATSLVIVNEDYPIDSISFRTLLNHSQHRYRVPGCPILTEPSSPITTGVQVVPEDSRSSLPLNEPRRKSKKGLNAPVTGKPPRGRSGDPSPSSGERILPSTQLPEGLGDRSTSNRTTESNGDNPQNPLVKDGELDGTSHTPKDDANDELTEYICLLQQYKDLPLDDDDDDIQSLHDTNGLVSDSDSGSGSKIESPNTHKGGRRGGTTATKKVIPLAEHFVCNRGDTKDKSEASTNPNSRTIEVLQSMCDYYTRINDQWRTIAYRKAINTLRRQTVKITTEEEAYRLPTVGQRLAQKIEEIAQTDGLRRLEYAQAEPLDRVLETFLKIYDVGTSRASKWIAQGFRTLDDLKEKADLTVNQRLGIDRYDDLNTRIPRSEVAALGDYVRAAAAELDPSVELLTGGSYRRGSDSSGDIDLIVTRPGTSSAAELVPFLDELVAVLTRRGFLVATLASLHGRHHNASIAGSKWHGCCVLPPEASPGGGRETTPRAPIWRRIDFLLVPETEFGAALIYFTGNDIFNRSMRLLASRKGMRLNQRGLYKEVMRGPGRVKVTEGELVEGRDEKKIFEILGVKWREPRERWC